MAFVEIEYDKAKTLALGSQEIKNHSDRIKTEVKSKLRKNLMGLCEKTEIKELMQKLKDFVKTQNQELKRLMKEKIQVNKKFMGFWANLKKIIIFRKNRILFWRINSEILEI